MKCPGSFVFLKKYGLEKSTVFEFLNMKNKSYITTLVCLFISINANAITLQNITSKDLTSMTQEVAAGFKHSNVGPASRTDKDFGYEIGILAGDAKTEKIGKLVSQGGGSTGAYNIPKYGLLFGLNLVHGISAEYVFQPKVELEAIELNNMTLAVKYQLNQHFELPVIAAAKLHYLTSEFAWSQTVSNVSSNVDFQQKSYGLDFQVSRKYNFVEPYANLGYITSTGNLESSGTSLFSSSYTAGSSSEESTSGVSYGLGVAANLDRVQFALEMNSVYSNQSMTFKTSAQF